MHNAAEAFPPPDPRIAELARACLEDLDGLIELWIDVVSPVRRAYADRVPDADFRDSARDALEMLLRTVAELPVTGHIAEVSERVGTRRARQGVPLDALLDAARLDFRVVWTALVRRAEERNMTHLVASAYYVWEAVERHVTGIMTAYQRTVLEMGRRADDERQMWFARLMDCDGRNPTVVGDAALALGFQVNGEYLCAAAAAQHGAALRRAATELRTAGVPVQQQALDSAVVLTARLGPRTTARTVLEHLGETPCGVSSAADRLADVPRAVRLAITTARSLPVDARGPRWLRDSWLDVLVHHTSDLADDLVDDVLGGLDRPDVTGAEKDRLLRTVHVHLTGNGAIADTAAAVYCHRNTVQHRFNRFCELTGHDVRRPEDAALIALALRARARGPVRGAVSA
ncbi:helix-turn-helix domain-containing protein [Streptomyces sp. 110]|uniref:Helix-turn-helix domain-containing protein n=1 Tax=Streptomyces endocoffeicus TaxID=2898945 RepID=A0ABS1Q5X3_9ACTN|nr:helix-turn-helix domain-containing protein [Streptomyces endocoffeicus]MBL1120081.1 helix-turn-helix domain-containing protein [Streptomyces endocoffeicus]